MLSSRLNAMPSPLRLSRSAKEATVARRGAPQVVAMAKKDKRKAARKAEKKAEMKTMTSKSKGGNDEPEKPKAPSAPKPYESTSAVMQSLTICGSYKEKTGEKLLDGEILVQEAAERLWKAPFVCASHDASDVFNYGNKAALELWGLSWDDFVGMPSTKSASDEDAIQSERRELLDKAAASGVIKDYSGVRQASDGRRFRVTGATVWTITDREGNKTGQAVRFDTFAWLGENGEETEMTVADGGELVEKSSGAGDGDATADAAPSASDIAAAAEAVEEAAAKVRNLKEGDGLTNADPEVQAAVSELLAKKSALAELEERAAV
jgi:hypothetical protein